MPEVPTPRAIAINNGNAYITDINGNRVVKCVVENDGSFSGCVNTITPITPYGITVYNNNLYTSNTSQNSITKCALDINGNPQSCVAFVSPGTCPSCINAPGGITISNDIIYIANVASSVVSMCSLDPSNGNIISASCIDTGVSVTGPADVTVY